MSLLHRLETSYVNNWERTVSIYSGGKLFNATGWKLGWCIGPAAIIHMGGIISNTVHYCGNTPGQIAMSVGIPKSRESFTEWGHENKSYVECMKYDY